MRPLARLLLLVPLLACDTARTAVPTLGEVVGRVDVPRLLQCAIKSGPERARCLGASVLTTALDLAVDKAADLAEAAQNALHPEAGAEVSEADQARLARELDAALADVAAEIERAG